MDTARCIRHFHDVYGRLIRNEGVNLLVPLDFQTYTRADLRPILQDASIQAALQRIQTEFGHTVRFAYEYCEFACCTKYVHGEFLIRHPIKDIRNIESLNEMYTALDVTLL